MGRPLPRGPVREPLTSVDISGPLRVMRFPREIVAFLALTGCASGDVIVVDGSGGEGSGSTSAGPKSTSTGSASTSSSTSTSASVSTTSSSSSMSTGSSSSSGMVECNGPADCPAATACATYACVANGCVATFVPSGTKTPAQPSMGSCKANVCDGMGNVVVANDDTNAPPATPCHVAGCSNGSPTMSNATDGAACAGGQCVAGACAACGGASQPACLQGNACSAANLHPVEDGACVDDGCAAGTPATCQCGHISPGQEIYASPGHDTLTSCDGRFDLVMQGDGNLVLYYAGTALWSSNTYGTGARWAIMQTDGNFVLYTDGGGPVWSTNSAGYPGAFFAAQDDGNLVVYAGSAPLWDSGTCCY